MASTIHLAAVAVALALLGGGALAAAQMGVGPFNGDTQSHPVAPMGGHGQEHGEQSPEGREHGTKQGHTVGDNGEQYEGMRHGDGMEHRDRSMNREECRHEHGMDHAYNITSINATIAEVDVENRTVVVSIGENESLTLKVKGMYTDTSTGYLVSGSWLMLQLEPGATVTVLVPENATSIAPLLGVELNSTLYITPGLEPIITEG